MACFVVATLLTAVPLAAQEVGYKDLTKEEANPLKHKQFVLDRSCTGGGRGSSTGIGCPPKTYPFDLLLLSVDTSEPQIDGELIALLRLRNAGQDPALVPWITDSDQIELPDETGTFKFSRADLRANITEEGDATAYMEIPVHLYGAKEVSGSVQEVRPGEYIELRIKLVLACGSEELHCQFLKPGPAKLSFTWTEWDSRERYKKCGIESSRERIRELTSNNAAIEVVQKIAPQ